jgi:hypothetical protein
MNTDMKLKPNYKTNIKVGDIIENFGAIVRVDEIEGNSAFVTIIPWRRDGVAQGGVGQRYVARLDKSTFVMSGLLASFL